MQTFLEFLAASAAQIVSLAVLAGLAAVVGVVIWKRHKRQTIPEMLKRHFSPHPPSRITVTVRQFPQHIRADLYQAISRFGEQATISAFRGVQTFVPGGADLASMLDHRFFDLLEELPSDLRNMNRSTSAKPNRFKQSRMAYGSWRRIARRSLYCLPHRRSSGNAV